jgi:hypothetical protein
MGKLYPVIDALRQKRENPSVRRMADGQKSGIVS